MTSERGERYVNPLAIQLLDDPLISIRTYAHCFQRRHLNGLRVIHRKDECSSFEGNVL